MVTILRASPLANAAATARPTRNLNEVHTRKGVDLTGNLSFHCKRPFFDMTECSGVSPVSQPNGSVGCEGSKYRLLLGIALRILLLRKSRMRPRSLLCM